MVVLVVGRRVDYILAPVRFSVAVRGVVACPILVIAG